jgi:hypothetical protein
MSAAINRAFLLKTRTGPTETVDSGEAYFWLEGTAVKYKDDTQTIKTLATGVTPEEVQDIIGTFITAGSSKVSVVYNDAGNTLTIDVVENQISHLNILNIGSNTHAQIDTHIANTSNPHGTTAAQVGLSNVDNTSDLNKPISTATQTALNLKEDDITATTSADYYRGDKTFQTLNKAAVGLGNVDNTSDANKPISTATQTALNLKYDASNPNGYETPAQLNTRDTNNRNRANHTGTQLSSTISDFSESVDDRVATLLVPGSGVSVSYNDAGNALTIASTITQYTGEDAQDAVGNILTDTASIDFTYNDPVNTITAAVLPAGVNHDALQNFVANKHIDHSTVSVLAGTGLTGGGDITVNRTLNLANTAVTPGTYGATTLHQITVDAQGRITAASNGPALALGDNFEEFTDLTAFTTTANTNQVAATFTTASKPTGKYRVGIQWDWSHNNATADSIYSVYMDGTQVSQEFRYELSDTATQLLNNHWFYYPTFGTVQTHTLELRCRNETAGQTVTVSQVRAEIWRVS